MEATAEVLEPRKRSMFEIQHSIHELLTAFNDTAEGLTEAEYAAMEADISPELDSLAEQEAEKADNVVFAIKRAEAEAVFLKEEEKRLSERRKATENRINRIKAYIRAVMELNGIQKIKGNMHTLSLRESKSVHIDAAPEDLPKEYQNVSVTADKTALRKAIDAGSVIDGVFLDTNISLTIR